MNSVCFNGTFYDVSLPVIGATNKAYRYGDGFFETIKVTNGSLPLWSFHEKRIRDTLTTLQYALPPAVTGTLLHDQVLELARYNGCLDSARIRLSFSHDNGSLFEKGPLHYLIEAEPFIPSPSKEATIGVFDEMRKDISVYAPLKLSNSFIYSRSAQFAGLHHWDECIILNTCNRVAETTISNIYWVRDGIIFTPPLSEGCINGVFRSWLLSSGAAVRESAATIETILNADEVFLTNALRGIRIVGKCGARTYASALTRSLLLQQP